MRVSTDEAADLLARGELVALPTETVYGLAARAFDDAAVVKIFERKGRPRFDPLIVHASSTEAAKTVSAALLPPDLTAFWPGPLTLVVPKRPAVSDLVTAGEPTVAVRVPNHPLALQVMARLGEPVAAPSANRFGRLSPTTPAAVEAQLGKDLPVVDGGPCSVGVESTIVSLAQEPPLVLRPGGVPVEELRRTLPALVVAGPDTPARLSPGRLPQHYAPRTRLRFDDGTAPPEPYGVLALSAVPAHLSPAHAEVLSPSGDLAEAARHLFEALRRLDASGVGSIVVERVPEIGLGRAIMDRLRRAAVRPES